MPEVTTAPTTASKLASFLGSNNNTEPSGLPSTLVSSTKVEEAKNTIEKPADTAAPKVELPSNDTSWDDKTASNLTGKYKNDPKEIAKALWLQQKEALKIKAELEALKKNASSNSKTQDATSQSPATTQDSSTVKADQPTQDASKAKEASPADAPAADANGKPLNFSETFSSAYLEAFQTGKVSPETVKGFSQYGMDQHDSEFMGEVIQEILAKRTKEAQSHVPNTPIAELHKFAQETGNYTDSELAVIQAALNNKQYGILRDVETRYKSKQKTTIQHGEVSTTAMPSSDKYNHPDEYYKDRADRRYSTDKEYRAAVELKNSNSDTSGWANIMLKKKVR